MGMRITNQMINNNAVRNLQRSMSEVDRRTKQMTSGKKISQASEDPVIAVRALKLRTTVNQLEQYKDKNIPDADSWYKISNTSLDNVVKRIKDINDYCVQGSTDSFGSTDRSAIIDSLKELQTMIYEEGNATYAGRYIFSGYKTDRPLTFTKTDDVTKYSYDITEHIKGTDLDTKKVVVDSVKYTDVDDYISGAKNYEQPDPVQVYRMNLAYEGIEENNNAGDSVLSLKAKDSAGNDIDLSTYTINVKTTDDADTYYDVPAGQINVIKETGEIIFGEDVYNVLKTAEDIEVSYAKTKFDVSDIRPEHYFDCTQYTEQPDGSIKTVDYTQPEGGQGIYYEVNFNQSVKVNLEGKDVITSKIGNYINDLIYTLNDLKDAEDAQKKLKAMLDDNQYASDEDAVAQINRMLTDIDAEIAVKKEAMQKTFSANITHFQDYLADISAVQSDIGSRMTKLTMIKTRVEEQYASFKELKSQNEDMETEDIVTDFNEANLVYESALAATSNVMDKTLLDYI